MLCQNVWPKRVMKKKRLIWVHGSRGLESLSEENGIRWAGRVLQPWVNGYCWSTIVTQRERQAELPGNGVCFCNLKVRPQGHTSSSKTTPPNPSPKVLTTGDHFFLLNIWAYVGISFKTSYLVSAQRWDFLFVQKISKFVCRYQSIR